MEILIYCSSFVGLKWLRNDTFQPNGGTPSEAGGTQPKVSYVNRSRPTKNTCRLRWRGSFFVGGRAGEAALKNPTADVGRDFLLLTQCDHAVGFQLPDDGVDGLFAQVVVAQMR